MRKNGPDEIIVGGKLTRKDITQTCSSCGDTTHNKRRCKKLPPPPPPPYVNNQKTRKRKVISFRFVMNYAFLFQL